MDFLERARREVEELHAFFADWYSGRPATGLERVSSVLAPEFELLAPSGGSLARGDVLLELETHRGAYPGLAIAIESLQIRPSLDGQVCARYAEIHLEAGTREVRWCCSLLRPAKTGYNGLEWVAIYERHDTGSA